TPPTPPTPTPPTPSPTASNQPPIVVGLSQKIVQPTAPAKLEFEVYAADDKGVSSVELLKGSDNLGNMTSIGDGYYSLTLNNYSAGSYSFRVKVTDNGNPALSVLSADIVVDVRPEQAVQQNTQPSNSTSDSNNNSGTDSQNTKQPSNNDGNRTSYIDNTGRKISYRGDVEQRLTPLAMREAVPQMLVGTVESAFKIADKVVSPVSPSTAKILPYTTLTIIAILGLSYAVLAFKQAIVRRQISELVARFKKTEENRRNYLDLIAHYLNTPVAKMQMALELLQGKKDVPEKLLVSAESRIKRLHNHVNSLLLNSQSTNTVSVDAARSIEITNKSWLVTNLGFILPAAGAIVITIILNALFVWSKKYDTHILNVIIQTGVGVASVIGLGAGFNYFRTQKEALLAAQKELDLERSVAESQTQFIQASGTHLAEDMSQIQTIASVVSKTKAGAVFNDGMTTLGRAVDKLSYLNEITSQTIDSVNDPIQIDILTRQT
ncbi:hypothetical protein KDA11_06875, partial [Candidatus Saccharibacteria bacterium]|nr:hypothetical protein [Candidatus Saccharibacteria bacterium]